MTRATPWLIFGFVALAGCHLGKGMDMPPVRPDVIAPDPRAPSEIDPSLHVSTGPLPMEMGAPKATSGDAQATSIDSEVVWLRKRVEELEMSLFDGDCGSAKEETATRAGPPTPTAQP